MKRNVLVLLAFAWLPFSGVAQSGQAFIDAFTQKNVGYYKEVKTMQATVNMNMMGMQVPVKQLMEYGGGMRMEIEMFGQKMIQVYDGTNGWLKMGDQPAMPLPEDQLRQMRSQQAQSQPDAWARFVGKDTQYMGTDNRFGTTTHKLRIAVPDEYRKELLGNPEMQNYNVENVFLFVEDGTHYVRAVEFDMASPSKGNLSVQMLFEDWKLVDGLPFSHKIKMVMATRSQAGGGSGNLPPIEMVYSDVRFNQPIPAGSFAKPE